MSRREWAWVVVAALCAVGWFARPLSSEALASAFIGAVFGAVISYYFYRQASDELKDIHDRIVRMLQTISGGGRVTATQDEQGNTVLTHHITATDSAGVADSVQTKLGSDKDPEP
jgi:flagellar motor component MotA